MPTILVILVFRILVRIVVMIVVGLVVTCGVNVWIKEYLIKLARHYLKLAFIIFGSTEITFVFI